MSHWDALPQPTRDLHEDLVPDLVAELVVDILEAVEVDEESGHPGVVTCPTLQCVLETVAQEPPIRQPGEWVVQGCLTQVFLQVPLRGDVLNTDVYSHVMPALAREAADQMGAALWGS